VTASLPTSASLTAESGASAADGGAAVVTGELGDSATAAPGDAPDLRSSLAAALDEIQGLRQAARQRAIKLLSGLAVAWVVGGVIVLGLSMTGFLLPAPFYVVGLVVSVVTFIAGIHGPQERYQLAFKAGVIGRLVADRYQDARFNALDGIGQTEFEASQLYRQGIDRYSTEDLIEARLGDTSFRMAEIHAEYKTTSTDGKGHTTTHWHTIFKGRFLIALFSKRFQGTTLVLSEAWRLFGISGLEKVALEDPNFEKLFAVYASDQVEARYILSPSLMERLVACRRRLNADVQAAFMDDHVILAIPDPQNRFEPPSMWSSGPLLSDADVDAYAADIAIAAELIDELNLNRRIWERG